MNKDEDENLTISDVSKIPLTDSDIRKYIPNVKILNYDDLSKVNSIIQILPSKKDAFILIYEAQPNIGHWVCIIRENKTIIFFDPYGYRPDKFLSFTPQNMRKVLNQEIPHLTLLLNNALDLDFKVVFNEFQFQDRNKKSIATCGRHVVGVMKYFASRRNPTLDKYYKLIMKLSKTHQLTPDLLISKLVP